MSRQDRMINEMASKALAMTNAELVECHELEKKITQRVQLMSSADGDVMAQEDETLIAIVCHMAYDELVIKNKKRLK